MNPHLNSVNGFGGGFIAFWPSQGAVIVVPSNQGGGGSQIGLLLREDQEIIDIITAIGPLLVRI